MVMGQNFPSIPKAIKIGHSFHDMTTMVIEQIISNDKSRWNWTRSFFLCCMKNHWIDKRVLEVLDLFKDRGVKVYIDLILSPMDSTLLFIKIQHFSDSIINLMTLHTTQKEGPCPIPFGLIIADNLFNHHCSHVVEGVANFDSFWNAREILSLLQGLYC